jgi:branched-chain amino acid transport system permease protein
MGSLYLLQSLGFSLICGVLRVFHMGYGIAFVVTVYATWMFMKELGLGLVPAILAMCVFQCLFTLLVVYFPIVRRYIEKEEILLTALLLVAMIGEETVNYFYPVTAGVDLQTTLLPGILKIGKASVPNQMLVAAVIAIITTALFILFFLKTKLGLLMRAVSQDTKSAKLMGTNTERVYALAMILSVVPPTVCMLTIAPVYSIEPTLGWSLLQTAILVSVLGGLGNLKGSIIAAYILGFVAALVSFAINPRFASIAALLIVFLVLIFRPQGIGRSETLW